MESNKQNSSRYLMPWMKQDSMNPKLSSTATSIAVTSGADLADDTPVNSRLELANTVR